MGVEWGEGDLPPPAKRKRGWHMLTCARCGRTLPWWGHPTDDPWPRHRCRGFTVGEFTSISETLGDRAFVAPKGVRR